MQIATLEPAALDAPVADAVAAVCNRANAVDAPHLPEETGQIMWLRYVHGWDGEGTDRLLVARDDDTSGGDGRVLAYAEVELPRQENLNVVWFTVVVDPEHRRRGIGSALLAAVTDVAREVGRGLLMSGAWHGSAGAPFLKQHEFAQASIAAQRRLYPRRLPREGDAEMLARARESSAGYELFHVLGPLPEEMLGAMLSTVEAINDAPLDDLELEDDNITVDRMRRYDAAQQAQEQRVYRIVARSHDGSPAGHSVVAVDGRRPHLAEQHDTTVRREHRGHRLGLRLKLEMLAWLRDREPQLEQVDTWNQESNTHMIAVNDAIGCTVVGRHLYFQRHL
jgi:GNAT superfamily N-acetyltransferase